MVIPSGERAVPYCLDRVWSHRSAHDPREGGELVVGVLPIMVDDESSRGKEVHLSGHRPRRHETVVIPSGVKAVSDSSGQARTLRSMHGDPQWGEGRNFCSDHVWSHRVQHDTSHEKKWARHLGEHPVMRLRRTLAGGRRLASRVMTPS